MCSRTLFSLDIFEYGGNIDRNIKQVKQGIVQYGDLKACLFDTHVYQPVMHVSNSTIQIAPVSLNEREFQFVKDLREYVLHSTNSNPLYILRNEGRGKGIGFFEARNFYPDFLLWKIKGNTQCIAFIEPHGLVHTGSGDKKIKFHKTIKTIQERLSLEDVCLNSFIVTPTSYTQLPWDWTIETFSDNNVFFMHDSSDYISRIVSKMEQ